MVNEIINRLCQARRAWHSLLMIILVFMIAACGGSPNAAPRQPDRSSPTRAAAAYLTPTPAVEPVRFPEDEAPHDVLTEWWYYTGHLFTPDGARYGFEYVIFQANRANFPTAYAAHFAITDNARGQFHFDERTGLDARQPAEQGFNLDLNGWTMRGAHGSDELAADMPGYAIDLSLTATKPPALHNTI